ncbi:MAG TPA: hypothetical protein VMS64_01165 [Candidatus Methylomirabilis sp.]|nr:hypothetical protein [Candidatus Methylomirabilis sp.]
METPVLGWTVIGIGVVVAFLSALANPLGLGRYPGFGWKKTLVASIGVLLVVAGLRFLAG